jgi:hypothetical protein
MDPQRSLYQVPLSVPSAWDTPYLTRFKVELNSSKDGALGPLYAYFRNFVCLVDYDADESDTALFCRPTR